LKRKMPAGATGGRNYCLTNLHKRYCSGKTPQCMQRLALEQAPIVSTGTQMESDVMYSRLCHWLVEKCAWVVADAHDIRED
jgi:hypothetical protein